MLIDTHAHLNFNAFAQDRREVIRKCLENGIWMINIGTDYKTSKKAVEIAEEPITRAKLGAGLVPHRNEVSGAGYSQGVFAAIGLHPINLDTGLVKMKIDKDEGSNFEKDFDYNKYKGLAQNPKVVAIGEIGLDYWRRPKTKKKQEEFKNRQKELFKKQLDLAKELNLPVILHCRIALDDMIEILSSNIQYPTSDLRGVIHCFTGNWLQAQKFLEMGFYIGFNGIIFKLDLNEVIKKTPLDKILIETDCPYLVPPGFDEKRNNPFGVKIIAEHLAKIKNIPFEKIAEITFQNAKKLFEI